MIYLLRSFGEGGKSILKIGFSDNLENRLSQYFYSNPFHKVISTKEGDEIQESLLHLYLGSLGYSFTIDGKLSEWYIDNPDVERIFGLSLGELCDEIWESRDKVFDPKKLKAMTASDYTYRLFDFLYKDHKDTFCGELFKINDGSISENESYKEVDEIFWESYINFNSPEIKLPDIYSEENLNIASEFLDNYFYKTGIFRDKMKMYCEFCDQYKDNQEIMNILDYKILNSRFRQFYEYFGTKGCSSRGYEEKQLLEAWGNDSKEEKLVKEIFLNFKVGDRYSSKDIKIMIGGIYQKLGITKTAKATDLGKYFTLTKTKVTLSDKTIVNGFKLEKL